MNGETTQSLIDTSNSKANRLNECSTKHLEVYFGGGAGGNENRDSVDDNYFFQQPNTCRILQRKLELKVAKAKRNYEQSQDICAKKTQCSNLIPINRLNIPGFLENQPLVDYKSESEDQEEIGFFPPKLKAVKRHELSDTFSIQEMTIESDNSDDSNYSTNLELHPPRLQSNIIDKVLQCFYCIHNE